MDAKTLAHVVAQIHKRFPEFDDVKPRLRKQPPSPGQTGSNESLYLLTFQKSGQADTASGPKVITRLLRVVVSEQGAILKVSTSR